MKTKLSSGLFFFLFLTTTAHAELCVQSFNAYTPAYASRKWERLERLSKTLSSDPCDAIQFQELWKDAHLDFIQKNLSGARYSFINANELRRDRAIIGIAGAFQGSVLSAFSELFRVNNEDGFLDWVRNLTGVQKGYTALNVKFDHSEQNILLLNVHTHPQSTPIRIAQMLQLADYLLKRASSEDAIILTGDLNATPDSIEMALLKNLLNLNDSFLKANKSYEGICTYCGNNPLSWSKEDRVIDFILYRSSLNTQINTKSSLVNLQGDPNAPLSDHYGVRSIFEVDQTKAKLLDKNDPIVLERVKKAVFTLEQSISLMEKERNQVYESSLLLAENLKKEILSGSWSGNLEIALRIK